MLFAPKEKGQGLVEYALIQEFFQQALASCSLFTKNFRLIIVRHIANISRRVSCDYCLSPGERSLQNKRRICSFHRFLIPIVMQQVCG